MGEVAVEVDGFGCDDGCSGICEFVEYLGVRQCEFDFDGIVSDGSRLGDGVYEMRIDYLGIGQTVDAVGDVVGSEVASEAWIGFVPMDCRTELDAKCGVVGELPTLAQVADDLVCRC